MNNELTYVDSADDLLAVCRQLQTVDWLAVDTEFERIRTYFPELCLVQVASRELTAVIDPLRIADLEPLYTLLYDPAITKVFHSSRQDLELFFHLRGEVPLPLFDTQLAAAMLGHESTMGYANLVQAMLGIELSKSQTRTNWKRRPLHAAQLRYAADDVIYLGSIYEQLREKMQPADWQRLQQEQAGLSEPALYLPEPDSLWRKIREARRFKGEKLRVLQVLAGWREITARSENRPRKWVLSDVAIIDMARLLPQDANALAELKSLDAGVLEKYAADLLLLIRNTLQEYAQQQQSQQQ